MRKKRSLPFLDRLLMSTEVLQNLPCWAGGDAGVAKFRAGCIGGAGGIQLLTSLNGFEASWRLGSRKLLMVIFTVS